MQEHSSVRIEEVEDDDEVINLLKEFDQLLGNVRMVKAHLEKHDISEGDPENIDKNDELLWWYLGVEYKQARVAKGWNEWNQQNYEEPVEVVLDSGADCREVS